MGEIQFASRGFIAERSNYASMEWMAAAAAPAAAAIFPRLNIRPFTIDFTVTRIALIGPFHVRTFCEIR